MRRFGVLLFACAPLCGSAGEAALEAARELTQTAIIADTHIDVPYRLQERWEDVTRATAKGDFDWPRARAGGLDLPFMSIYTPAKAPENSAAAREMAHRLIDSVEALVGRAPEKFQLAATPQSARQAIAAGRMALALGMENGSPIDGDLANVARFRERGISYITLAHSKANHLADSSYDTERPNGGLSEFGRAVVREMNRVGMIVDVSHLSDEAFWQVLDTSRAPVMASHSSARHFTPGFERNMSDEMIRALADRGGLIMINFGSGFLTAEARAWRDAYVALRDPWLAENGFAEDGPEATAFQAEYRAEHAYPFATLDDVLAHFRHVINLVGVTHVGIGSDFDGVGDSLPEGLKDVSAYPNLVAALRAEGLEDGEVAQILGGNLLRVWDEVVALAD